MFRGDTQILIVGAGPTGLALACHCLRMGLRVRILDKKPGPSATSKAIGLQYRVSEVLACMGVVDRFLERGGNPTTVNLYAQQQSLLQLKFQGFGDTAGHGAFAPQLITIPQSETEQLLWDEVRDRGGDVEWNTEFLDFTQDANQVVSRIRRADGGQELVVSDFLVSCEGAHSVIRRQAGLSFVGKTYPMTFLMADVEMNWSADHRQTHVWLHSDGSCAAMPFAQPRRWRLLLEVKEQTGEQSANVTLDDIRQLLAERTGDRDAQISNSTWISEFRIHCRMVDHYRNGRVLVAGDAAHIHSPTGGQGITTGMQDASNLAWKLGRVLGGAPANLLDTYEEERLPKAREVLHETNRITTLLFAPNLATRLVRDLVVLPLLRARWTQRKMFAKLAQLHVNYRGSRLAQHQDAGGRTRLRAGDRAPDIAFHRAATREPTTLFRLLQGMRPVVFLGSDPRWTDPVKRDHLLESLGQLNIEAYLLIAPEEAGREPHPRCLIDTHGEFRRLYGMSGEFLCLIRPDDHIGLFQRPIRLDRLQSYLKNICAPASVAQAFSPISPSRKALSIIG